MGLGQGHTLEEGTVPLKTAEIPGGTSTLQFEQVHQCLYAGTLGAPPPRGEGPHDNLNHTLQNHQTSHQRMSVLQPDGSGVSRC